MGKREPSDSTYDWCPITRKIAFYSRQEAKKDSKKKQSRFKVKHRTYRCPFCGHWHHTTKERK